MKYARVDLAFFVPSNPEVIVIGCPCCRLEYDEILVEFEPLSEREQSICYSCRQRRERSWVYRLRMLWWRVTVALHIHRSRRPKLVVIPAEDY